MSRLTSFLFVLSLVSLLSSPPLPRTPAPLPLFTDPWRTECIDCPPSIDGLSSRTAALAPDGVLHAVYGNDGIYHVTYDGNAPAVETLAAPAANVAYSAPVMAIDGRGRVHSLYQKTVFKPFDGGVDEDHTLHYARQTAQGWRIETLPYEPAYPYGYSLVVTPDGQPHIAAKTITGFIHASRGDAGWSSSWTFGDYLFDVTLTLDHASRPAACFANGPGSVALATFDGANWHTESIPAGTYPTDSCDFAFAADGRAHLVIRADEGLLYLWPGPTGWVRETIARPDDAWQPGYAPSLQLDASGRAHVAYHSLATIRPPQYTFPRLMQYATRTSTGWRVETVDDQLAPREGTMVLTSGVPTIVYRDRLGLALAERRASGWATLRLVRAGNVGYAIRLVSYGPALHAAYFDLENEATLYAAGGPGAWRVSVVDQHPRDTRQYHIESDLALAPDGRPHVVYEYYDPQASFLYAIGQLDGQGHVTGWQRAALLGDSCGPYRLVVRRDGRAAMTQHGCGSSSLQFVPWPPPAPPYELVDATARNFGPQAMAADAQGRIHVAYAAETEFLRTPIRYARREPDGRWTIQTIEQATGGGGATGVGLALDAMGQPFVVYNAFGAMTVATPDAAGVWQLDRRLAAAADNEAAPEIAVDAAGQPHVLYNAAAGLTYARRDAAGWRSKVIGPTRGVHSLALDPFGNPAVAYQNPATGDALLTYIPPTLRGLVFAPVVRR